MSNPVVDIAQALVTAINGGSWSQSITAVLGYLPQRPRSDFSQLRVTVIPVSVDQALLVRNKTEDTYQVDIGVQKQVDVNDPDEITTLLDLVEEIKESNLIKYQRMASAAWIGCVNDPIYSQEHLHTQNLFTSVIRLSYRKAA